MQKSNIPPAVRFRDNQRRSRARHKEYVEDIKRKLLDLEERGVQATVEVQQAARKVAEENRLLRELLARKGVCQQEVDEFLRISLKLSVGDAVSSVKCQLPDQIVGGPGPTEHLSTVAGPKPSSIPPSTCSSAPGTGSPRPCNRTDDTSPPSSDLPKQSQGTHNDQHELVLRSTVDSGAECATPRCVPDYTGLDTSCEEAATVLAFMRGHGDQERARNELGCEALSSCRIKNTNFLDIMDA